MKSFLVCVAVLGLASSSLGMRFPKDDPKMQEDRKECAKEVGVEPDFIEKIFAGAEKNGKPDFKQFETHEAKCFLRCMHIKMEILNGEDEVNMEKVKEVFDVEDDIIEKGKLCVAENMQEDPCDRIHAIHKCIMGNIFKGKMPE